MTSLLPIRLLLALCLSSLLPAAWVSAQPSMVVEPDTLDLGEVFIGDTVSGSFRVINTGDSSFLPSGASYYPRTDLSFDVFKKIPAGDTLFLPVVFIPQAKEALLEPVIVSDGRGARLQLWIKAAAIPRRAYLGPVSYLPLTIKGCPQGSLHQVMVINPVDTTYTLDSIRFNSNPDEGWRFIGDVPADGTQLAAHDTLSFFVSRETGDRDVALNLFSALDTDRWTYKTDRQIASPYIRTPKNDTIAFDLKIGDTVNVESQLANRGPASFQIQSYSTEGDPLWQLVPQDKTRSFFTGSIPIIMRFQGASQPGIYTSTFSLSGAPCDTVLTKTFVAHVGLASVQERERAKITVFPDIGRESIQVSSDASVSYSIYDLLGRELIAGELQGHGSIAISSLPRGVYVLRTRTTSTVVDRSFFK